MKRPKRWEVWYAHLRPGIRGEQKGDHNVLIVASPRMQGTITLVVPITTIGQTDTYGVRIEAHDAGIDHTSWIECDQILALSVSTGTECRFMERRTAGIPYEIRQRVILALTAALGLDTEDDL